MYTLASASGYIYTWTANIYTPTSAYIYTWTVYTRLHAHTHKHGPPTSIRLHPPTYAHGPCTSIRLHAHTHKHGPPTCTRLHPPTYTHGPCTSTRLHAHTHKHTCTRQHTDVYLGGVGRPRAGRRRARGPRRLRRPGTSDLSGGWINGLPTSMAPTAPMPVLCIRYVMRPGPGRPCQADTYAGTHTRPETCRGVAPAESGLPTGRQL
jgi:hypothetical protein